MSASLYRERKGAVHVEFLIVFMPLFVLFLCIMQSALLRATHLGVQHAASTAVRAAIVLLPDDPAEYEGEGINKIERTSCNDGFLGKVHKLLDTVKLDPRALPEDGECPGGPRMSAIRFAAIMKMLPFAPNPQSIAPKTFRGFIEDLGIVGWVAGAVAYSYAATSVTFPAEPGADKLKTDGEFSRDGSPNLTVRVSYLAHCGIPIARFLMCDTSSELRRDKSDDDFRKERLSASQAGIDELGEGVGSHTLLLGLLFSGKRFRVLRADATLPINNAPYEYKAKE